MIADASPARQAKTVRIPLTGRATAMSNTLTGKRNLQTGRRNRLSGAPKSADRRRKGLTGAGQATQKLN
jgi:hypothetical protein